MHPLLGVIPRGLDGVRFALHRDCLLVGSIHLALQELLILLQNRHLSFQACHLGSMGFVSVGILITTQLLKLRLRPP